MTDPTPPAPEQPTPPPAYTPASTPTPDPYAAAPAYSTAPAATKTPILSILSLVASGIGFLGGFIVSIPIIGSVLDLFFPAAGIVLGFLARSKEPAAPKILWILGIVLGFVCVLWAIIFLIVWIAAFATSN